MSFYLPTVIQPKLAKCTIMTSQQHTLCFSWVSNDASLAEAQLPLASIIRKQHCLSCCQSRKCLSCISHRVLGQSQGEMHIVLFIQYQRYRRLNLNKEGYWTELSVWLPFRTAVNAILLIQLLKASLPTRSLCERNTMQAVLTPQKGIALESHTSAVWPLAVLGGRLNPCGHPVSFSQGSRIDSKSVICGAHVSKCRGKWQLIVFPIYTLECSAWVVETPNCMNLCLTPGFDWDINPRKNVRKCFTFSTVCSHRWYSFCNSVLSMLL